MGKLLSIRDVKISLERRGFFHIKQSFSDGKVMRFDHVLATYPVYLKQSASLNPIQKVPLIIHPSFSEKLAELRTIAGVFFGKYLLAFSSNMEAFPKKINDQPRNGRKPGQLPEPHGIELGFEHEAALDEFVDWLTAQRSFDSASDATSVAGRHTAPTQDSLLPLTETEREAIIKARIGQGIYRAALIDYWGSCSITGCANLNMLRASHAKPWFAATSSERLDPFNGLLLTPNLDLAFDQGLISFNDDGQILISNQLDEQSCSALNLWPHLRLRQIEPRHRVYLAWHRDYLFKK